MSYSSRLQVTGIGSPDLRDNSTDRTGTNRIYESAGLRESAKLATEGQFDLDREGRSTEQLEFAAIPKPCT